MRFGVVGQVVRHARRENETAPVLEFGLELSLKAAQYVAFCAPVIGEVARCVLDLPEAKGAEVDGSPVCRPCLSCMMD